MERKTMNKNALRSIRLITSAYLELISEMPIEKVSVTKIVERADLNRSTFYAHFTCPQDVLDRLQNEAIENIMKIVNDVTLGRFLQNPMPLLSRVAEFIEERKDHYRIIVKNQPAWGFLNRLKEILVERMLQDVETLREAKNPLIIQANLRFFAGGYISLFHDWILGELDMSLEDMTKMTARTISGGISTFL